MNKSVIGLIITIIIIVVTVAGFAMYRNSNARGNVTKNEKEEIKAGENIVNNTEKTENTIINVSKTLVVYYSAQNHTKLVAEKVATNLNADIFEIVPEEIYTSDDLDWTNSNSRVSREHNDESLKSVKLKNIKIDSWENYDTVLIGYPIWWGEAAWVVNNFVKNNDFTGKTVIPFCTSASSSLGNSGKLLEDLAGTGNWQDGHRFPSCASDTDIKKFTDSIK